MPDAVLVADKQRSQDVKRVVELLKSQEIPQAESTLRDHRPWGYFESLVKGADFKSNVFVSTRVRYCCRAINIVQSIGS